MMMAPLRLLRVSLRNFQFSISSVTKTATSASVASRMLWRIALVICLEKESEGWALNLAVEVGSKLTTNTISTVSMLYGVVGTARVFLLQFFSYQPFTLTSIDESSFRSLTYFSIYSQSNKKKKVRSTGTITLICKLVTQHQGLQVLRRIDNFISFRQNCCQENIEKSTLSRCN